MSQTKVQKKRLNGGERITWPLTPTARCIDCGSPIVHLSGGKIRLDPHPAADGTLAVVAGHGLLHARAVTPHDTRTRFTDHATTCTHRTTPAPAPTRRRRTITEP